MSNPTGQNLTVKQQREARRTEKLAQFQKQQAKQKRNQRVGLILGITGVVAVVGLLVTFFVVNSREAVDPDTVTVEGVQEWTDLVPSHVVGTVEYEMTPPAGGPHNQAWLTCGTYTQPVPNENAVHSLEHGAVWITYDPAQVTEDDINTLRAAAPATYTIISPYEGLDAPVYASSWGRQIALDSADDPRLADFITKYWRSADVPEPGATCLGGVVADGYQA